MSAAPVLVLTGPTACGKSALGLEVAERIGAEIISADSCAVYRGMDIGAAKPSAADMRRAPHHLVDVCDPDSPYSAGAFCADAIRIAGEIRRAGECSACGWRRDDVAAAAARWNG